MDTFARFQVSMLVVALYVSLMATVVAEPLTLEVVEAQAGYEQRTRVPIINITVSESTRAILVQFSSNNIGRWVELRVNGKTILKTIIREPLLGRRFQISGPSTEEAQVSAAQLSATGVKVEIEAMPNQ